VEQSKIIIPDGYESVILREGEYGKLKFGGELLDILATSREVGPSDEASALRGYRLGLELKTNLMTAKYKDAEPIDILVHVPGDKGMDSRPVKDVLKKQFGFNKPDLRRADEATSKKFKCVYGTVNPFSEYLSPLPQFVSEDLFATDPEKIGTNAGALNRYVRFLAKNFHGMKAYNPQVFTGDFSKES